MFRLESEEMNEDEKVPIFLVKKFPLDIKSRESYHIYSRDVVPSALSWMCGGLRGHRLDADCLKRMTEVLTQASKKKWRNAGSYMPLQWLQIMTKETKEGEWTNLTPSIYLHQHYPEELGLFICAYKASQGSIDGKGEGDALKKLEALIDVQPNGPGASRSNDQAGSQVVHPTYIQHNIVATGATQHVTIHPG